MKQKIIIAMFTLNILGAKELDMQMCLSFLGGGIYNGALEEFCGFKGNLQNEMKALYTEGGCRRTVPQSEVDRVAKEVTEDIFRIQDSGGINKYCKEHKKQYYKLLGEI